MCARPPFELVSVSPAREAKSAPSALPMEGFNREARGQPNASPSLDRYAPYRTQSARKDELPADMRGFRSVQSGPAGLTHSTETSAASLATRTGPEAKAERGAYSLAPDLESLAQSTLPRETSAQVPSFRAFSEEGCSSSQARCATTSGCGSNSHRGATASGCGSTRPVVICGSGSPDAAAPSAEATRELRQGQQLLQRRVLGGPGLQGSRRLLPRLRPCLLPRQHRLRANGTPAEAARAAGAQGPHGRLEQGDRGSSDGSRGVPRVRPSIARVTARRVVKRKAMEEAALPATLATLATLAALTPLE